jgi:hypothetical protein
MAFLRLPVPAVRPESAGAHPSTQLGCNRISRSPVRLGADSAIVGSVGALGGKMSIDTHTLEVVLTAATVVLSLFAVLTSAILILQERKQKKIDYFMSVQQFLHDESLSDCRAKIREGSIPIKTSQMEVRRVCSSFDFAGTIVRNRAIDQKLFFEYWGITLLLIKKRLDPIAHEPGGENVKFCDIYREFWWLMKEAQRRVKWPPRKSRLR